ncbi:serine hydrolase domain-containing protein [Corynebacterium simulans]|uniref:serine hydrolase domain-containing protein n=1 Tax=Corynebacterium simulans TaxID=146827 RepID=UPI0020066C43|nr:serine hydrolase domain-containing protein [Corynebacterium simulans]MCK6159836.1 beta-lactamase family protein [Corynebacterium simulans]
MNFSIGKLAIGFLVTALVASGLVLVGPHRIALATEATGSTDLAQKLRDNAQRGHHNLTAFTLSNGKVSFAGLGADEHTEVEIGSVTKMFTAELIRQEVSEGNLKYDVRVGQFLDTGDSPISDVRIEELMEHTSGLPRLAATNPFTGISTMLTGGNPYAKETKEQLIDAATSSDLAGRGEENYSNLGYGLLGLILEEASGKPFEQLLQEKIFAPIGMQETYLMTPGSVPSDAPRGYTGRGQKAQPWEFPASGAAGGIRSTPKDMSLFANWLIEHGDFQHGWQENEAPVPAGYWHNGGTYGYSTMLIIDPQSSKVAFVSNDTEKGTEELARTIFGELH